MVTFSYFGCDLQELLSCEVQLEEALPFPHEIHVLCSPVQCSGRGARVQWPQESPASLPISLLALCCVQHPV